MDIFSQEIENYITSHIEPEPDFLKKLVRDTNLYTLKPRMLSGHLQGRLLKMFCAMTGAKRVVEIGTFTGYSALCMAEALPDDGEVHTIDINDEL
ncbi:MAG: methyltransferase, partial [Paludibacteraceae bacterium]|nr:methyltransferase [Paludibacteraceae bacterium]